jgi:PAS domain S-box-containing protein
VRIILVSNTYFFIYSSSYPSRDIISFKDFLSFNSGMKFTDLTNETIFQQSPISTQIFSPMGESVMANKAWEALWGIKHSQIAGYNVLADKQLVAKGIMPYIKRGFKGEIVQIPAIKYEPGKTIDVKEAVPYRWVSALIYPVRDETDKIIQIVLQHQDKTEQIESEEKLIFHANVLENINNSVITTDLKGNITYWNKGAEVIFGYTADEMMGRTLDRLYPNKDLRQFRVDLKQIVESSDFGGEWQGRRKGGELIWITVKTTLLRDRSGRQIGFIGVANDITERKRMEEAMRQSEERLRLAVDAGKIGVWDWDIVHNTVIWSDRIYEIHGLAKDEYDGTVESFTKLIHKDDLAFVNDLMKKALEKKAVYQAEFRARGPEGKTIWIYTSAGVLFENNRPVRMLGATIDITERKKLEKQKDEFIGLASHELKTPVTSIKAYAQILERSFVKKGDVKAAEFLGKMDRQIDKLTGLIGDLLDVTRIEEGRLKFREERFDFNELVREICEEVQRTTDEHTIVLRLSRSRKVFGDRERVGQVIMNFLTNAIKYSPGAREVIVATKVKKGELIFSVQDFGFGISNAEQQQIFERFFRVNSESGEEYPGLGLGLYISREIVMRQGGRIWVESVVGKGSTFYFTVPLSK